jgi:cytochrome c biogenesis factor
MHAQLIKIVVPALAILVVIVLGFIQYRELRRRRSGPALSTEDAAHYRSQDRRRTLGLVILTFSAIGVVVGTLVPVGGKNNPNLVFIFVWLGVIVSLVALLLLALRDWAANAAYARRHLAILLRERRELVEELRGKIREHQAARGETRPTPPTNGIGRDGSPRQSS